MKQDAIIMLEGHFKQQDHQHSHKNAKKKKKVTKKRWHEIDPEKILSVRRQSVTLLSLSWECPSLVTQSFHHPKHYPQLSSDQSLSRVRLFGTPWIAARQASLSITNSRSSLRLTSIESVMPSRHLILCHPLLLLPPIRPSHKSSWVLILGVGYQLILATRQTSKCRTIKKWESIVQTIH